MGPATLVGGWVLALARNAQARAFLQIEILRRQQSARDTERQFDVTPTERARSLTVPNVKLPLVIPAYSQYKRLSLEYLHYRQSKEAPLNHDNDKLKT